MCELGEDNRDGRCVRRRLPLELPAVQFVYDTCTRHTQATRTANTRFLGLSSSGSRHTLRLFRLEELTAVENFIFAPLLPAIRCRERESYTPLALPIMRML